MSPEEIGVKKNGETVPIKSVCTGITHCGECGVELNKENSSGWETLSSTAETIPTCDKCCNKQGSSLQEQLATCVFCGTRVTKETFHKRYAKRGKPLGSVCTSCYKQLKSIKNCKMCKNSFDDVEIGGIYAKNFDHIIGVFCKRCVNDINELDGKIMF